MLKHILAVGALCSALLVSSQAQAQTAYQNLPLEDGNMWVFITDSEGYLVGDTQTHTMEVTREWYLGRGWFANLLHGLYTPDSEVIMYDYLWSSNMWVHDGSAWSTAFRFAAAIGEAWHVRADACDSFDVERYDTAGATITVPAGDFAGALGFLLQRTPDASVRCSGPSLQSLLTVPGIGPIAFSTEREKGHLMYARVSDRVVAAAPHNTATHAGIETTLLVADDELVHPTIVCITTPCIGPAAQLNVVFVARNVSDEAIELNFADSQAIEIDLLVNGEIVRRHSDGRQYSPQDWNLTLQPGESHVFHGHMPLSTFAGSVPLVGDVQVTGYIASVEGQAKVDVPVTGQF